MLTPIQGAAAGALAGLAGGAVTSLASTWSGGSAWLLTVGFGAAAGILYAMSLRRISAASVLAVGAFYGLVLWIAGGLLWGWVAGAPARDVVRSAAGIGGYLVYGFVMAVYAIWKDSRGFPTRSVPLPD